MKRKFIAKLTNGLVAISNRIAITILIIAIASCNTTKTMHSGNTIPSKLDSLVADADGNKYPVKIFSDHIIWMTANLKQNITNSYCYNDSAGNCEKYGRLYTWEAAKKACGLLGGGWRLPTNEEWKQLAVLYGDGSQDSVENRKRAYNALMYFGNSQFNAVLGGNREPNGQYARVNAHGFYWTSTENDSANACFSNFGKGSQSLYHQDGCEKNRAISVRCVKAIDVSK